ncbi:hypothetical protein [Nocardia farcinica]|uniref:hypothetical protein n=1 Tax=Nocardia farcinica TaxID=37329 RepID=UPI002457C0A2|nr:hypothetical protein [Nocardia farcinica]
MNVSARLRRTSVALLMAVLLIAPILHCTVHGADEHTHPVSAVASLAVGSSHTDHLHGMNGHLRDHGDQHMIYCIEKSLLPSGGAAMPLLLWMAFLGMVAVAVVALIFTSTRGIRGPPGAGFSVLNGRAILTNFCISRR